MPGVAGSHRSWKKQEGSPPPPPRTFSGSTALPSPWPWAPGLQAVGRYVSVVSSCPVVAPLRHHSPRKAPPKRGQRLIMLLLVKVKRLMGRSKGIEADHVTRGRRLQASQSPSPEGAEGRWERGQQCRWPGKCHRARAAPGAVLAGVLAFPLSRPNVSQVKTACRIDPGRKGVRLPSGAALTQSRRACGCRASVARAPGPPVVAPRQSSWEAGLRARL